jgi:hypothetical protein
MLGSQTGHNSRTFLFNFVTQIEESFCGQDVWSELGPPSGTSAKGMDTMLIHMKQASVTGADYFYSYHSR